MYRLVVYGGEYEDSFEHIYYSNSIEKLKEEGMEELTYYEEAYSFRIHEIKLEDDEVKSDPYFNPLYETDKDSVRKEINFRKLTDILKFEETDTVKFKRDGEYYNDETSCNIEIVKMSEDRINIIKLDEKDGEILDLEEYTRENCEGNFVEEVIEDYEMYCERKEYEEE